MALASIDVEFVVQDAATVVIPGLIKRCTSLPCLLLSAPAPVLLILNRKLELEERRLSYAIPSTATSNVECLVHVARDIAVFSVLRQLHKIHFLYDLTDGKVRVDHQG